SEEFVVRYGVNAIYQLNLGTLPIKPFALVGLGWMSNSSERDDILMDDTDFVTHAGLGARVPLGDSWGLRVHGRIPVPPSSAGKGVTVDGEALLSIYKLFGGGHEAPAPAAPAAPSDPDHDGIVGDADKCPTEPEDKDGFEDEDGCPDPDNDKDGIA